MARRLTIANSSQLRQDQRMAQLNDPALERNAIVRKRARQRYLAMGPAAREAYLAKYGQTLVTEMLRE